MSFRSIDPYRGQVVAEYEPMAAETVSAALDSAGQAQQAWRAMSLQQRLERIDSFARQLSEQKAALSRLITQEMGKLLSESEAEVDKCITLCHYYCEQSETLLLKRQLTTELGKHQITTQPLGVILGIMPWNFPLWQVLRFAIPTLVAGNTVLLKHAPNVTGCAMALEKLFKQACPDLPILQSLVIDVAQVESCLAHPTVQGVSLTGSTRAGMAVASLAGRYLKKSVLELGGSDPYLILPDADLSLATEQCATSRLFNAGQTCVSAKRFIVCEPVYDAFLQGLTEQMQHRVMGDPLVQETSLAPMVSTEARDGLHAQVMALLEQGANCILGGELPTGAAAFYPPTIVTQPNRGDTAYREELFGPVAMVIRARDTEEAIAIANDCEYGLGAGIFSQDKAQAEKIAMECLQVGTVAINGFVKSDPRLPFGGIKHSGYGRELADFGLHEFVNVKTVSVCS